MSALCFYFVRKFLECPWKHQAEDRKKQANVQKKIACCKKTSGQDELNHQIRDDQQQADDGQQPLAVSDEFG